MEEELPWGICELRVIMRPHTHYCTPKVTLSPDLGLLWSSKTILNKNNRDRRRVLPRREHWHLSATIAEDTSAHSHEHQPLSEACCGSAVDSTL
jgi:hypothetical protein